MNVAVRGFLAAAVLLSAAVAATAAAGSVAPEPVPRPAARPLPVSTAVPVNVCPGPQTLLAPAGARPVAPPGPVVVSAVATGQAGLGGLVPPEPGQPLEPADPVPLASGRAAPVEGQAQARLLTQSLTTAGGVRFDVARTAPGEPAPASSAVQATLGRSGDLRGLAASGCSPAVSETWLVGGGTADGERSRLVLSNPTPSPALLDVLVHGPDGEVKAPAGEGIVVAAGDQQVLFVDALAPGLAQIAVQVTARTGRVVASMQHSRLLGFTPGGVDDVAASAPPGTVQLVPGVVQAGPGRAVVRVAVPGPDEAVVRVSVVGVRTPSSSGGDATGPDARPVPAEGDASAPAEPVVVNVPGGAVRDLPLTGLADGRYVAVVSADVPVVAGAISTRTRAGGELAGTAQALGRSVPPSDLAWAPSAAPLRGAVAAAVPRFPGAAQVSASLIIAAPRQAARVELRQVSPAARMGGARVIDLADGQVAVVDLSAGTAAVLLTPQGDASVGQASADDAASGEASADAGSPVVGALLLQAADDAGPMLSVVPLRPGPEAAGAAPEVVQDDRLGLGVP